MHPIDKCAAVFENASVDAVSRRKHHPFISAGHALEVGNARCILAVQDNPSCVFTNRDDARREAYAHAANDALIVEWARTLCIDAPEIDAVQNRVRAAFAHDGVRVTFGPHSAASRTYALIEGPQGIDPSEIEERVAGRWYHEAIIALAIEPTPADALQHLQQALGGPGAPAGIRSCETAGAQLLIELLPSVTQPSLVLRIVDVELQRFKGYRRTQLLTALPVELIARIAADGLEAPQIASDRILESLLEAAHVE